MNHGAGEYARDEDGDEFLIKSLLLFTTVARDEGAFRYNLSFLLHSQLFGLSKLLSQFSEPKPAKNQENG